MRVIAARQVILICIHDPPQAEKLLTATVRGVTSPICHHDGASELRQDTLRGYLSWVNDSKNSATEAAALLVSVKWATGWAAAVAMSRLTVTVMTNLLGSTSTRRMHTATRG